MAWIDDKNLPVLPDSLLPMVLHLKKGEKVSKDMEIIACSNQYWQTLSDDEQSKILELVEWLGGNRNEYIRKMKAILPNNPRGK